MAVSSPSTTGYDMASGLGTPVASQLANGLMAIPLAVAVSGSQSYGGTPTFTAVPANYAGTGTLPYGVTGLNTSGLSCTTGGVGPTPISPTRQQGLDLEGGHLMQRGDPLGPQQGGMHHRLHQRCK